MDMLASPLKTTAPLGMRRVRLTELGPDQRTPLTLYRADQHCAFPAASLLPHRHEWLQALRQGLYVSREQLTSQAPQTVRQSVQHAEYLLRQLIRAGQFNPSFMPQILHIVQLIQQAWRRNPDCVLASILLRTEDCGLADQVIHSTFITEAILSCMPSNPTDHAAILCACLCAAWPGLDRGQLERLGVKHPLWLEVVSRRQQVLSLQACKQSSEDHIELACQTVVLAEQLCIRIQTLLDAAGGESCAILRDLLIERGRHFDARLASYLLRALGLYPIGSVLKLASGEVGVVFQQGEQLDAPWVAIPVRHGRIGINRPTLHDTHLPQFQILTTLSPHALGEDFAMHSLWGQQGRDYELTAGQPVPAL